MGKLATVILGTLGGFVAGILLAPKSGKETREDLKRKAETMKEKSSESFDHISQEAKAGGRKLKDLADDSFENLKANAKEAREEVSRRSDAVKAEADSVKNAARRETREK